VYFLITKQNHSDFSEGICKNEWNLRPKKRNCTIGFDDGRNDGINTQKFYQQHHYSSFDKIPEVEINFNICYR
jgi:hypothetical protein